MASVEQVTPPLCDHGEGPVWFAPWGGLRWVDMLVGDVLALDHSTGETSRHHVGSVAAVLRPRRDGGTVLALERGFALLPPSGIAAGEKGAWDGLTAGAVPEPLGELWSDPGVRMNEGGCDPDGVFYCGSMAYDKTPGAGRVYRLGPDLAAGTAEPFGAVTISNGFGFSPDHTLAYYIDTPTRRIDVFDFVPGRGLSGRRPFVRIPDEAGVPDGLTVDAEGGVWVALWGGSAVHRYAPDGSLSEVLSLPATQVTACVFGGDGLDELYVTTSQQEIDPAGQPAAGALFRAEVGVRGLPVLPFAG
ncbi:SMP-30/gluconolactonase/LRE family protein [Allostreptomyces psammosilenae]|uniref:Sugar lactone lactonase YvrE n=1 Tax=Allostreptomyces psammosilenae TaxID=1892865 RepID=A0A853A428_9ACTN|nr:SMP-30/gluconolactonase/LRE family protein [Allostreptomyces psammosilenae]NYI08220.1 sugar lactone lactonase YvrE [Allostreptomyces psammosilenae]